ncbi:CBF-domain-containing protein [Coprinopsis marcescibilis]|uniref:CBF-domain-containing protein n=1 Tax=Coprinopsis marcescibilis TaxID=230819 RepID=A0A5C3KYV2_COPMA|nr:CBF-domain-containing protein [Coprinopsis marcescibilis]
MAGKQNQWYTLPTLPVASGSGSNSSSPTPTTGQIAQLFSKASDLHFQYSSDTSNPSAKSSSSTNATSEATFLSKIIQSGTLSDRLSALTLLVQGDPIRNVKALETLRGMGERGKGKGGRDESLKALRCVVDWWVGGGAPNRKLKYFREQPLLHSEVTDQHLLVWFFEDWLKKYFFSVLQILETLSLDTLPYVRTQSLALITTLLRDKPEQEQNLLRLLVNKLGDPEKSICSRASYHLLQVLQAHPSMKAVIVREISALILRPLQSSASASASTGDKQNKHIRFSDAPSKSSSGGSTGKSTSSPKLGGNPHARYYGTITLNQVVLSASDKTVAGQLLDLYFDMFRDILGEDETDAAASVAGDEDGNATSKGGREEKEVLADKKGRIIDYSSSSKHKKGRGRGDKDKEHIGAAGFAEIEDTNARLISAILTGVNRALPFAKVDAADSRIEKHLDTLFLITHTSSFNTSIQALLLIQQISVTLDTSSSSAAPSTVSNPNLKVTAKSTRDRYYRALYASLHDPRLADSSKQAMYLNLLFKSLKHDVGSDGNERILAIVRRFVQILVSSGSGSTEFVAGGLYLLGELFSTIPGLRKTINTPARTDVVAEEAYDARKRDPQYAHADASPLWELTPLLHHYHPAIALHARQLLLSQPLTANADLSQNTLSHFLDRFVYKNAKKVREGESKGKGSSAMQPVASAIDGVKLAKGEKNGGSGGGEMLMNDQAFLHKRPAQVPVDQRFFYEYLVNKKARDDAKNSKIAKRKVGDEDEEDSGDEADEAEVEAEVEDEEEKDEAGSDAGSEVSEGELDEEEVWKAMQASMPKLDNDDSEVDIDSEPDLDDLEDDESVEGEDDDEDEEEEVDDDDQLSLVEGSDNEDLLSLNDDVPDGLMTYERSDEEWGGVDDGQSLKRKRDSNDDKKARRKKLRSLPAFASYEDYAKLIEDGPEDNI